LDGNFFSLEYSNGDNISINSNIRNDKDNPQAEEEEQHWREDNTLKQGRAPPSVKAAAALFLDPLYRQLEAISVGAVAGNGGDGGGGR
jgi:hypothetical protein